MSVSSKWWAARRTWRRMVATVGVGLLWAVAGSAALAGQEVTAVRSDEPFTLDGRLEEAVWERATPAQSFVQREPVQGDPASDATEVRFAYDEDALWIGARMASSDPEAIRALVTRRDRDGGSSEQLTVSFDTHHDRRTAVTFAVTPAAVRIDYLHRSDYENDRDYAYDPVWAVETARDAQGWTAEMRIPFDQLRFSDAPEQLWGVNVVRHIPAKNEVSYWALVGRQDTGWSSRMGLLRGLTEIQPPRGLEALPYVAVSTDMTSDGDPADPFFEERASSVRVGGDLKARIGSSFTLDATFNPDFGQVEADPAEVNLTAYETFFAERRPFFTEGASLFNLRSLFYSRRVGARPPGSPTADYVDEADHTTILGAAKLTGRMPSGLSVGALAAVTGERSVRTFDANEETFGSAEVAPRTTYLVGSAQQEFGADASTIRALITVVDRGLESGSPLSDILTERAYSGVVETRVRWAGGAYDLAGWVGGTHVRGSEAAILAQQLSSRRYWQRPDADHVEVDPTRTSLTGNIVGITHSRLAGNWLWDIDLVQESPGFEPNDAGSLGNGDDRVLFLGARYRETDPGRFFRNWIVGLNQDAQWTFGGERQYWYLYPFANAQLPNFWRLETSGQISLGGWSNELTRGGPLMRLPREHEARASLRNSPGARDDWALEVAYIWDDREGSRVSIIPNMTLRPGDRWELTINPEWSRWEEARQFILSRDGGRPETFGRRYVFSHVERSEVSAQIRLNYTFTPNLTLETYIEPFASAGRFHSFGELEAAGGDLLEYGTDGTTIAENEDGSRTVTDGSATFVIGRRDFNIRSLRSNLVLRWEWQPGSTAYLVWQQDGSADRDVEDVRVGDVFDAFDMRPDHFFAVKLSFWVPVR